MKPFLLEALRQFSKLSNKAKFLVANATIFTILLSAIDGYALLTLSDALRGTSSQSLFSKGPALAWVLGLFIAKSILAAASTYFSMKIFEKIEITLGNQNLENLSTQPWEKVRNYSFADFQNILDKGPNASVTVVLFSASMYLAELANVLVVSSVLLVAEPGSSSVALVFFGLVFLVQNRLLGSTSRRIGEDILEASNGLSQAIFDFEGLGKLKYIWDPSQLKEKLSKNRTNFVKGKNLAWYIGSVPRYFMESVLAIGLVLVAVTSFAFGGPEKVFPTLSIFAAAGYRLLPTVNRLQSFIYQGLSGVALSKTSDIEKVSRENYPRENVLAPEILAEDISLKLESVSYKAADSDELLLDNISLEFKRGQIYALVGESGAGKTTLADLMLGLINPHKGLIRRRENQRYSYVPQETFIIQGSLSENISLGSAGRQNDINDVLEAIGLSESKNQDPSSLSGGQTQRIGIARALLNDANFIILDEATSALDAATENSIMKIVEHLRPGRTIVLIAHRLSTIKNVDKIIYLEKGSLLAVGTWKELLETCKPFRSAVEIGSLVQNEESA